MPYTTQIIRKEVRSVEEMILKEQQRTNVLLEKLIKQNDTKIELLTAEDVQKETGIGINMVRKMFKDPELAVQRYTSPFKVSREALNKYLETKHDYLCK